MKFGTMTGSGPWQVLSDFGELCSSFSLPTGVKNFWKLISGHTFCRSATKFGSVRGLTIRHLFPEFAELWSVSRTIPCGDVHPSFTDALVCNIFQF